MSAFKMTHGQYSARLGLPGFNDGYNVDHPDAQAPNNRSEVEYITHSATAASTVLHVGKTGTLDPYAGHIFAEGGTRAWLTCLGTWIVYFVTFGLITSFGVFESYYVTRRLRGKTPSEVAWIGSLQICLLLSTGVLSGKLFDEGYFHHLMAIGSLLEVIGLLALSFSTTYTQVFLSQGLCCGLGMGLMFLPAVGVLQHHFHTRRAFASGIAATGTSIGGIIFSIMFNQILKPTSGVSFETGCRISTGVVAVLLGVANLVMKTDLPPRRERKVQIPPPSPVAFFKDVDYVLFLVGGCLCWLALYIPVFYLQLDAELHGVNPTLAFYLLTIYNAASLPGRIVPNIVADRHGIFNASIFCLIACAFITLGMLGISSRSASAAAVIVSALYGFFSGAVVSLLIAVAPAISRGPHEYGVRIGIIFLLAGPFALLSGPIAGWLLGPALHWKKLVAFTSVVILGSAAFVAAARHVVAKRQGSWRV